MKLICILVIFLAVASVFANEIEEHGTYETYVSSEETTNFEDLDCIEEGTCIPMDELQEIESPYLSAAHEDDGYLQDAPRRLKIPHSHYTRLCHRLGQKMQELEALHPEMKDVKLKLLRMLDAQGSGFKLECQEGESVVIRFLDLVISFAEKLKSEYSNVPVVVSTSIPTEEIIAEEYDVPVQVGSVRGIPGEHYPNYSEVPITSFSCSDKKYIPGFYADLETGCQVFHVCYEHRRESFLCPVGTIFNQPILACDYWYSSNCSQAPLYYDVNAKETKNIEVSKEVSNIGNLITTIIEGDKSKPGKQPEVTIPKGDLNDLLRFLPIKAKVVEFEQPRPAVFTKPIVLPQVKLLPIGKPKLAAKAALKLPLAKAKFAAVPVVKAKAVPVAFVPVKAKVAVPVVKSKFVTLPLMKTKYAAGSVPALKAKTNAKVMPFVKLTAGKSKIVPAASLGKAKMAKSLAISPLTTKALALGYMKLLKAKKLALVG